MKIKNILWFATVALIIASVIDIVDGDIPKMISSISLTLGFASLALGQAASNKKNYYWSAYGFLAIALVSFALRLLNFYNT